MQPENKLADAFGAVLGDANGCDWKSAEYGVTPGWDSMAHLQLVAAIESAFDILLSTDEVISLSNYARAKEIVVSHGCSFDA